jgi:hypothetical protein
MRSRRIPEGAISQTQDCFVFRSLDISKDEIMSVYCVISKSDGIGALLARITEFGQIDPASPTLFALENDAFIEAAFSSSCERRLVWDCCYIDLRYPERNHILRFSCELRLLFGSFARRFAAICRLQIKSAPFALADLLMAKVRFGQTR